MKGRKGRSSEVELELLLTLTMAIVTSKDLTQAINYVLKGISETINWEAGDGWIVNQKNDCLEFVTNYCADDPRIQPFCKETEDLNFKKGQPLPGAAWKRKNSYWEEDVCESQGFKRKEIALKTGLKTGLAIPIPLDGEVIAVICFYTTEKKSEDKRLVRLLTALGGQLGVLLRQKQTEEELVESEMRFFTMFNTSPEAIILSNEKSEITDINLKAEEIFGYSTAEVVGKHIYMLKPERFREAYRKRIKDFLETENEEFINDPIEMYGLKKNGNEFPARLTIGAWKIKEEVFFTEIIQDITVRKHTEKENENLLSELKELNNELEQRVEERTKELTNFAHVVSHDLKAPLRAIQSLSDWILQDEIENLSSEGEKHFELLMKKTEGMSRLIDGVLGYSRAGIAEQSKEKVDTKLLVTEIIESIDPPEDISIQITNELPVVCFSKVQLAQVFQNLIENSIKYMDKKRGLIEIGCEEEEYNWKFWIKDNGPGIEKNLHDEVFKMMKTLPNHAGEDKGTGIGLATVKKVVEANKGKVWLEPEKEKGAVFYFTIIKDKDSPEGSGT